MGGGGEEGAESAGQYAEGTAADVDDCGGRSDGGVDDAIFDESDDGIVLV